MLNSVIRSLTSIQLFTKPEFNLGSLCIRDDFKKTGSKYYPKK